MYFDRENIERLQKRYRINLINSSTGIKPANLIGSVSETGQENLSIFSSVIHLGSNPALIGFMLRPAAGFERHTWENIQSTGVYSINHVAKEFVENAHFTSAKFPKEKSEFSECHLKVQYMEGFSAPFVRSSPVKLGMRFIEAIPISHNQTSMIIGRVEHIIIDDDNHVSDDGNIDLVSTGSAGVSGLSQYFTLINDLELPYARPEELPDFVFKD